MKHRLMRKVILLAIATGLLMYTAPSVIAGQYSSAPLSSEEKASLTFMREEEKLARDVYTFLYERYQAPIFSTIATSEQRHMDAIKVLLDKYGLADPAQGKGPGEFENQELQNLYNALVAEGAKSLVDALKVGVIIEEEDIPDLQAGLLIVNHNDIKTVYLNLLDGSRNHLKAFVSSLTKLGVTFEP